MVAAWISALIGVGPAIASGSQVCSGNCADLPTTPQSSSRVATVVVVPDTFSRTSLGTLPLSTAAFATIRSMLNVPKAWPIVKMPNRKPTSPSRVVTNALTAPAREPFLLPVVADEEVRADAHDLPADEQHEQVVGEDHQQHRGGEERHERGVRRVARVALEVRGRVDLHHQRDDRDRDRHDGGQPVEAQVEAEGQPAAERHGVEARPLHQPVGGDGTTGHDERRHQRHRCAGDCDGDDDPGRSRPPSRPTTAATNGAPIAR